jgi:hypothetical protein
MTASSPIALRGEARISGGSATAATITFEAGGFRVAVGDAMPWSAAYRDVAAVVVDAGAVLAQLGTGAGAQSWVFERFGSGLGAVARGLRDGRLRQLLSDGLVEVDDDEPIELVEFAADGLSGVAQLLYHDRGVALAPLDERLARLGIRRADIGTVVATLATGSLRVEGAAGPLATGRPVSGPAAPDAVTVHAVELLGLGAAAERHRGRWVGLRDGAAVDCAAIVAALLPDAPFDVRRRAASVLLEGRPADAVALGDAWEAVETAVLTEPAFAESYRALVDRAGGPAAARWLALAPDRPGIPDPPRIWFLVGLPGNLVAMELVSAGAHATYLFRVAPRATYGGGAADATLLAATVHDVCDALVDGRFLREPMAIPGARLAEPRYLRYRLAIAALPSLAAARARFVARIVHRDPASWADALDDLIRWHGSTRDEAAEWPGRATEEARIDEAGATGDGAPEG